MSPFRLFLLFLLITGLRSSAQEGTTIAEEEVLQRALEANTGLKISDAEYLQARAEYRQTRTVFLPNITASHTGITTTNPLMAQSWLPGEKGGNESRLFFFLYGRRPYRQLI